MAWIALAVLLAALALLGQAGPQIVLEWQPTRFWPELWRAFTPVAVHYSLLHLAANLAGTAAVGALGWAARLPRGTALAWLAAWPLTHLTLALQPDLMHYGGLSGVLHAGVAVVGTQLVLGSRGRRRAIGIAVLAVLAAKVLAESPLGPPLRYPAGWDMAVAPIAHAAGALAGSLCALAALALRAWRRR